MLFDMRDSSDIDEFISSSRTRFPRDRSYIADPDHSVKPRRSSPVVGSRSLLSLPFYIQSNIHSIGITSN